ncbi:uncharacterized protein BT62DRAFT_1014296 [Guyanagaster necrorhizus]|uniref:Uncharacterized protein n=1 Tax=Guyanagaster necrorhizus TaxID=856835 RepID=A0A9P7VEP3_9AGAR|nr:uncharacterized protein BT62DRAFT_1014296 [Guyanagaster necrorhizus MCA 3950]KAG7439165.1 hypothetical protein BT62DRAFT_1014296 [Guyanagaster necrorhizus MCA 3950]
MSFSIGDVLGWKRAVGEHEFFLQATLPALKPPEVRPYAYSNVFCWKRSFKGITVVPAFPRFIHQHQRPSKFFEFTEQFQPSWNGSSHDSEFTFHDAFYCAFGASTSSLLSAHDMNMRRILRSNRHRAISRVDVRNNVSTNPSSLSGCWLIAASGEYLPVSYESTYAEARFEVPLLLRTEKKHRDDETWKPRVLLHFKVGDDFGTAIKKEPRNL